MSESQPLYLPQDSESLVEKRLALLDEINDAERLDAVARRTRAVAWLVVGGCFGASAAITEMHYGFISQFLSPFIHVPSLSLAAAWAANVATVGALYVLCKTHTGRVRKLLTRSRRLAIVAKDAATALTDGSHAIR